MHCIGFPSNGVEMISNPAADGHDEKEKNNCKLGFRQKEASGECG